MTLIKICSILFFALLSTASASEKAGEPAATEEAVQEEAPVGDGEKHPDAETWVRINSKMQMYQSRMETEEARLSDLVRQKNNGVSHIKDEKKGMIPILEVIVESHTRLEEATLKYNDQRRELIYRYPGGKELLMRKYIPQKAPSVKQVEKELGLDGALTELKRKIDKKYSFVTGGEKIALPTPVNEPEGTIKTETEVKKTKPKLKLVK